MRLQGWAALPRLSAYALITLRVIEPYGVGSSVKDPIFLLTDVCVMHYIYW